MHSTFSTFIISIALTASVARAVSRIKLTDTVISPLLYVIKGDKRDCSKAPETCSGVYAQVDILLEQYVLDTNLTASMQFINDQITEIECQALSRDNSLKLSALNQISRLEQTQGPGQCHRSSSKVLEANGRALHKVISPIKYCGRSNTTCRPLVKILRHYLNLYFQNCGYKTRLKGFDEASFEKIKIFISELIAVSVKQDLFNRFIKPNIGKPRTYVHDYPREASKSALTMRLKGEAVYGWVTVKYLNEYAQGEPIQKVRIPGPNAVVNEALITDRINEYIMKPCKNYTTLVDSLFSNYWATSMYIKMHGGRNSELFTWLAYYRGCMSFVWHESDIIEAVSNYLLSDENF